MEFNPTGIGSSLNPYFSATVVRVIVFLAVVATLFFAVVYVYNSYKQAKLTDLDLELRRLQLLKIKQELSQ